MNSAMNQDEPISAKDALLGVLVEARDCLAMPENDFDWSGWEDAEEALRDMDGFIDAVAAGRSFNRLDLSMLFGPTGPIQEVSMSSGWGKEFLSVAERFDAALNGYRCS
jgi:hypothetical protein